ncbi:MAG: FAD-dependent oxidoreductase [Acidiferrobacterales bacterium]|nr:FAD-dependent oxidoreductase [Acidiferrobacterales bacterium]
MNEQVIPSHARVVIIGGGIMGCGLAYHLAHEGMRDSVLFEKSELTSGSTWHAAGQITQSISSVTLGRCVDYNIGLYSRKLESETGVSTSWHGCGSLRLAYTEDERDWLLFTMSVGRSLGFRMEIVGPDRIRQLHPFYNMDGVLCALHTPDDGHVDPSGVTQALAVGARKLGVRIIRRCRVVNLSMQASGEWCVETEWGDIRCEHVVNAAGTYARQIGEWNSLQLPMTSMTHHYFVTDPVEQFVDLDRELPVVRDDRHVSGYIRMEQKSGLIGIYEKTNPRSVWEEHCPWEAENELFAPDYERVMPWLEQAMDRMPILGEVGIRRVVHGAISHPPDGNPLIGPVADVPNYWCCCGTQIGIGWGPGLTRALAQWMVHGSADISMREFDPRRFGSYADKSWQVIKAKEDFKLRHEIPFPHFNRMEGRPVICSPLYSRLKGKGAVFEDISGHERPRWFSRDDVPQRDHYSFRRSPVHDCVNEEVAGVRNRVGIMDISAFAKVLVTGTDATDFLDKLSTNVLPRSDGGIVLSMFLNRRGRIELETVIVRINRERYYLICAVFYERRLLDHLGRHRTNECVQWENLSESWSAIAINGPRSRDVLKKCVSANLENSEFPWFTARQVEIAGYNALCLRMSYAGELGWELHMPSPAALPIYDDIAESGREFAMVDYGSFAMNVLRLEKAFKGAAELTNEVSVAEADVLRYVKLDRSFVGIGATALEPIAQLRWICAYLEIEADGHSDGHGGETVLLGDRVVGSVTSIAYSHTMQTILAFAYVDPEVYTSQEPLSVVIQNNLRDAKLLSEPAYDPERKKLQIQEL